MDDAKKSKKRHESIFDGIVKHSPALHTAHQIGCRVSFYGFDWDEASSVLQKVKEEVDELDEAIKLEKKAQIKEEIGDLLFSIANLSRHLGINPEIALKQTNDKFIRRVNYIEQKLKKEGKRLGQVSLERMDEIWEEAKSKIK
ncbi:MAG: MazG nucleotide pyrophosphohydrolase domain-containing protein [Acidobacteriota bacterium]|nr:MazG nucleotide pyrophosphohydrolase domain-containing protein [Acidobacteriota bacterium]